MDIFERDEKIYPPDYPQLRPYGMAILRAFWTHEHFTYDRDVKDFKTQLSPIDRNIVKRCMLSIGVVENKVKTFWPSTYNILPKSEIGDVVNIFAGNEVVHKMAYVETIDLLGLREDFENISNVECMRDRIGYLNKCTEGSKSGDRKKFTKALITFSMLMENSSLFMYFFLISSYSKYKNVMKNFNKIITATAKEEIIHGRFGAELVNIIRDENPEWFDDEMEEKIRKSVRKAYEAESKVIDWVMEIGEPSHTSKDEVLEFLKIRLNDSLGQIGYTPEYEIDEKLSEKSEYMERMLMSTMTGDFFDGKITDYNEQEAITEDSIWS